MLIVKQINWSYRETVIGRFNTMRELYNHFCGFYKHNYNLASRFSFNPRERWSTERWMKEYETGHYKFIAPVFCMYIENEDGVRYSTELIKGLFNKFRRQDNKHLYTDFFRGYKRHSRGHCHKRLRTTQEHRMAANVLVEEGEPKWRGKRTNHNLPTAWDDLPLTDWNNRNWKRYRKQQWKPK